MTAEIKLPDVRRKEGTYHGNAQAETVQPHTLITAVFSAAGVESIIGGIIKSRESKEQSKEKSTEDEEPPRKAE